MCAHTNNKALHLAVPYRGTRNRGRNLAVEAYTLNVFARVYWTRYSRSCVSQRYNKRKIKKGNIMEIKTLILNSHPYQNEKYISDGIWNII